MKSLLATLLLLSTGSSLASAQAEKSITFTELTQKVSVQVDQPLVIINGQETTPGTMVLPDDKIAEMHIHKKGSPEAKKYSLKAEKDVIVIKAKEGVDLVKFTQILDHFNVPASQRTLKVSFNRTTLVNPELILADLSEIEKVEVAEAGAREFAQWGWNKGEKFLNIVTKKQE